jgi:hypothetical protein
MTAQFSFLSSKQPNGRTGSIRAFFFLSQDEERRKKEKEKKLTIEFKYARSRSVGRQHGMNARPQHILSVGQNRLAWEKKKRKNDYIRGRES